MTKITLKGSEINTSGTLPKIGAPAPDFVLVDGELKEKRLADFKGKRVLLSFVPSLDTPVCSLSAKKFNDSIKGHPEAVVIVISCDLPFAQKRVCGENVVPLSMMRGQTCARDYGVLIVDGPLAGLCARAIVVLDEQARVVYEELVPEIAQEPDYEKALEALKKSGGK